MPVQLTLEPGDVNTITVGSSGGQGKRSVLLPSSIRPVANQPFVDFHMSVDGIELYEEDEL